jgi:hypothetical protein
MNERLLRFTRNDNVQCAIKVHGRCHCGGPFPKQSPRFHKGTLVAAVPRYAIITTSLRDYRITILFARSDDERRYAE